MIKQSRTLVAKDVHQVEWANKSAMKKRVNERHQTHELQDSCEHRAQRLNRFFSFGVNNPYRFHATGGCQQTHRPTNESMTTATNYFYINTLHCTKSRTDFSSTNASDAIHKK